MTEWFQAHTLAEATGLGGRTFAAMFIPPTLCALLYKHFFFFLIHFLLS